MTEANTKEALEAALEPFSRKLRTANDVKVVAMRMDAIVAILLGSPFVQNRLGAARTADFASKSPELPVLLRELGDPAFLEAADHASDLLDLSRPSIIEGDNVDQEIVLADDSRQRFRDAFAGGLAASKL